MPAIWAAGILGGTSLLSSIIGATTGPSYPNPTYGGAGGGQPYYYQPTWQGGADTSLQGYFQNYQNPYMTQTPAGVTPSQYATGLLDQSMANPYANNYMTQAGSAGARYGNAADYATQAGQGLYANSGQGLSMLSGLAGAAGGGNPYLNPMVQGAMQGGQSLQGVGYRALDNASSLSPMATGYANALSSFATGGASNLNDLAASTTSGILPYGQNIASSLPGMASSYAQPGNAAAGSILNTAFDPQGSLYNQQFQQNQEQTRASLAARGLNSSGVGLGIENQSNRDFNTNWQNQQLGRQTQGLSAYNANAQSGYGMQAGAAGQGLSSLISASTGTFDPYVTAYNSGMSGLNTGATTGYGLMSSAANQAQQLGAAGAQNIAQGGAMPYNAQQQGISDQVGLLSNIGQAQGYYGNLGVAGGGQLGLGANSALQAGATPYNAYTGIQNNYSGALNNYLGAAQYGQGWNQNQMGDLMQYMGMGPSAAQAAQNGGAGAYQNYSNAMGGLGNMGGMAAYMYPQMNQYPGGPTGFGNMFGSSGYIPSYNQSPLGFNYTPGGGQFYSQTPLAPSYNYVPGAFA